jgi:hypothetical protein
MQFGENYDKGKREMKKETVKTEMKSKKGQINVKYEATKANRAYNFEILKWEEENLVFGEGG